VFGGGGGDALPARPSYTLSLNIICMKFTSEGNQGNHEVLFQEIFEKRKKWSCGVLYNI